MQLAGLLDLLRGSGAYADLLRRRIAEKWRTNDVDAGVRTARPAVVSFDILRNGNVRNVKIVQSSGIPTLDMSARRAVMDASPLPELPREFEFFLNHRGFRSHFVLQLALIAQDAATHRAEVRGQGFDFIAGADTADVFEMLGG